jgi:cytochrome c2
MRYTIAILLFCCLLSSCGSKKNTAANVPANANIVNGEKLFKANCVTCHLCNSATASMGPSLQNIFSRWENTNTLYAFVQNSAAVIDTNAYAKAVYQRYNKAVMTAFPQLDTNQIKDILVYADSCE